MIRRQIEILSESGDLELCQVRYDVSTPTVAFEADSLSTGPFKTFDTDVFEALCSYRRYLRRKGYIVLCNGARTDAFPSAMSRDMGKGLKVYITKMGEAGGELVETLAPAPASTIGSVDEQDEFHRAWFGSWMQEK